LEKTGVQNIKINHKLKKIPSPRRANEGKNDL
jgi:hypothetical protein